MKIKYRFIENIVLLNFYDIGLLLRNSLSLL